MKEEGEQRTHAVKRSHSGKKPARYSIGIPDPSGIQLYRAGILDRAGIPDTGPVFRSVGIIRNTGLEIVTMIFARFSPTLYGKNMYAVELEI